MSEQEKIDALEASARELGVPEHLIRGLAYYIVCRIRTGSGLQAVIENRVDEVGYRLDPIARAGVPNVHAFLKRCAPPECFGSSKAVEDWIAAGCRA